jgi:serine/threonine-protein phosphatase 2A regulatory subunit B
MTVRIWDVNMENRPVVTIHLHDYLKSVVYNFFSSEVIFDKFEVCCSPNGRSFATGSYG